MGKQRIDPDDGQVYSYQEFAQLYGSRYSQREIDDYWAGCAEVGSKQKAGRKPRNTRASGAQPLRAGSTPQGPALSLQHGVSPNDQQWWETHSQRFSQWWDSTPETALVLAHPHLDSSNDVPEDHFPDAVDSICTALEALRAALHQPGQMRQDAMSVLALGDIERPLALMDVERPLALMDAERAIAAASPSDLQEEGEHGFTAPTPASLKQVDNVISGFPMDKTHHAAKYDRIYSPVPRLYGDRGGFPYYKPNGWTHFGVKMKDKDFKRIKNWAVAYHGTAGANAASILLHGLQRPGDLGIKFKQGDSGPRKTKSSAIYLSPSICVAAHPVYSRLFPLGAPGMYGQIVFKCRVRPESFRIKCNTLGRKHWDAELQMDPNLPDNTAMEWICQSHEDVRLTGLMFREFGPQADTSKYGDLPACVVPPYGLGPEYLWVELLQRCRRQAGHLVPKARGKQRSPTDGSTQDSKGTTVHEAPSPPVPAAPTPPYVDCRGVPIGVANQRGPNGGTFLDPRWHDCDFCNWRQCES